MFFGGTGSGVTTADNGPPPGAVYPAGINLRRHGAGTGVGTPGLTFANTVLAMNGNVGNDLVASQFHNSRGWPVSNGPPGHNLVHVNFDGHGVRLYCYCPSDPLPSASAGASAGSASRRSRLRSAVR